jgi:nucleolar protein 15
VIYLGRIPHGFYENEMRAYFAQFGTVTRLRLSRNKKTGHSKHYAFVEFASAQVAEIVAESMNNYLLYNHILKCSVIPPEKVHAELFKGANRTFKVVPYQKLAREQHNGPKTAEQVRKQQERLVEQENKKRQKLKEMGVDYTFQGYAAQLPATAQHVRYSDE